MSTPTTPTSTSTHTFPSTSSHPTRPFSPSPPRDNTYSTSRPPSLFLGASLPIASTSQPDFRSFDLSGLSDIGEGYDGMPRKEGLTEEMFGLGGIRARKDSRVGSIGEVDKTSVTGELDVPRDSLSMLRSRSSDSISSASSASPPLGSTSILAALSSTSSPSSSRRSSRLHTGTNTPPHSSLPSAPRSPQSAKSPRVSLSHPSSIPNSRSMPRLHQPTVVRSTSGRGIAFLPPPSQPVVLNSKGSLGRSRGSRMSMPGQMGQIYTPDVDEEQRERRYHSFREGGRPRPATYMSDLGPPIRFPSSISTTRVIPDQGIDVAEGNVSASGVKKTNTNHSVAPERAEAEVDAGGSPILGTTPNNGLTSTDKVLPEGPFDEDIPVVSSYSIEPDTAELAPSASTVDQDVVAGDEAEHADHSASRSREALEEENLQEEADMLNRALGDVGERNQVDGASSPHKPEDNELPGPPVLPQSENPPTNDLSAHCDVEAVPEIMPLPTLVDHAVSSIEPESHSVPGQETNATQSERAERIMDKENEQDASARERQTAEVEPESTQSAEYDSEAITRLVGNDQGEVECQQEEADEEGYIDTRGLPNSALKAEDDEAVSRHLPQTDPSIGSEFVVYVISRVADPAHPESANLTSETIPIGVATGGTAQDLPAMKDSTENNTVHTRDPAKPDNLFNVPYPDAEVDTLSSSRGGGTCTPPQSRPSVPRVLSKGKQKSATPVSFAEPILHEIADRNLEIVTVSPDKPSERLTDGDDESDMVLYIPPYKPRRASTNGKYHIKRLPKENEKETFAITLLTALSRQSRADPLSFTSPHLQLHLSWAEPQSWTWLPARRYIPAKIDLHLVSGWKEIVLLDSEANARRQEAERRTSMGRNLVIAVVGRLPVVWRLAGWL